MFVGRVQGMLNAAQEAKPGLVNWLQLKVYLIDDVRIERISADEDTFQNYITCHAQY